MQRIARMLFIALPLALLGTIYRIRPPITRAQGNARFAPYTIFMATEMTDAAGNLTSIKFIKARRNDGAMVTQNLTDTPKGVQVGSDLQDPKTRTKVRYEGGLNLKSTWYMRHTDLASLMAHYPSPCSEMWKGQEAAPQLSGWYQLAGIQVAVFK